MVTSWKQLIINPLEYATYVQAIIFVQPVVDRLLNVQVVFRALF